MSFSDFLCTLPFLSIIPPQSPQSLHTLTHKHSHTRHRHHCVTVLTQVGGLKSAPHAAVGRITGHWLTGRPVQPGRCIYTFISSSRLLTCIRHFCASIITSHAHFLWLENALEQHPLNSKSYILKKPKSF